MIRAHARSALAAAVLVVAVAPFFVALVAAHEDGWRPLGDDAAIAVLTHDVLSARTPLVGMPSTVNAESGEPRANHLGPMEFWTLAPLERLFRSAPLGILLGVTLINAVALVTVGAVTYRMAGAGAAALALALGVTAAWSLGRQLIVDPWNPVVAIFPMFALCVTTWAAVAGRRYALWAVALLASFVAQLHLLYVPLALALFASAVAGIAASWRRNEIAPRDLAVTAGVTIGILLLTWSFPLTDQMVHAPGNFDKVARTYSHVHNARVGSGFAVRVVAQAIGLPPLFARPNNRISRIGEPWSHLGVVLIFTAALVVIALLAGTVLAFRRRDRVALAAGVTACIALVVTTIVISRLPVTFPDIARYRLLQCWAIGVFTWLATAIVVRRAVTPVVNRVSQVRRALRVAVLVPIVVVLTAPVAVAFAPSYGYEDARLYPAVGRFATAISAALDRHETYKLENVTDSGLVSFDVDYGVYRELARRGFDMRVPTDDAYLARSHGASPYARDLFVVTGRRAIGAWSGSGRRIAYEEIATPTDHAHFREATQRLRAFLRDRANLTAEGRQAVAASTQTPDTATLRELLDGSADPIALLEEGRLLPLWAAGLLRADLYHTREVEDYETLRHTVNDLVFAAYLRP